MYRNTKIMPSVCLTTNLEDPSSLWRCPRSREIFLEEESECKIVRSVSMLWSGVSGILEGDIASFSRDSSSSSSSFPVSSKLERVLSRSILLITLCRLTSFSSEGAVDFGWGRTLSTVLLFESIESSLSESLSNELASCN